MTQRHFWAEGRKETVDQSEDEDGSATSGGGHGLGRGPPTGVSDVPVD